MNFKQFYLVQERKTFISAAQLAEKIINRLQKRIAELPNGVRSGQTIVVPLNATADINFRFFKGYPRNITNIRKAEIDQSGEASHTTASYYNETADSNGLIEVYINSAKKDQYYYRDRKFEDIVDKSLPKFIKDAIRHEVMHAYEDIVLDVLKYKLDKMDEKTGEIKKLDLKSYYNLDEEINANLLKFLSSELDINPNIVYLVSIGDVRGAVNAFIKKIKNAPFISKITPENKIWVLKTVYTFVQDLVEKAKKSLPNKKTEN